MEKPRPGREKSPACANLQWTVHRSEYWVQEGLNMERKRHEFSSWIQNSLCTWMHARTFIYIISCNLNSPTKKELLFLFYKSGKWSPERYPRSPSLSVMEMRFKLWSVCLQDTIHFRRGWKSEAHGSNLAYNDSPGSEVVFSFLLCFLLLCFNFSINCQGWKFKAIK